MAVYKCSECGGLVSDKAVACPHCGCPIEYAIKTESTYSPTPQVSSAPDRHIPGEINGTIVSIPHLGTVILTSVSGNIVHFIYPNGGKSDATDLETIIGGEFQNDEIVCQKFRNMPRYTSRNYDSNEQDEQPEFEEEIDEELDENFYAGISKDWEVD